MEKRNKIIYWVSTGLLSAMMGMGAIMYFLQNEMVCEMFVSLGYPAHLVYPLAIAKLLGIVAILTKKSHTLKEWAYAGFFFDLVLATMAHLQAGDGGFVSPLVALAILMISLFYDRKVFGKAAFSLPTFSKSKTGELSPQQ